MFMDKKVFRAWIMGMLALGFIIGFICAHPLKPIMVSPPLTPYQERAQFVNNCLHDIRRHTVNPRIQDILNTCTQNALALFPFGKKDEQKLKEPFTDSGS